MTDTDHLLLTRFNLPSKGAERYLRSSPDWLQSRVQLFERYCLPSVARQSETGFHWIIYLDPESPPWLKQWIGETSRRFHSVFVPSFRATVSQKDVLSDLVALTGHLAPRLITTNLDNDDALSPDFMSRVRALSPEQGRVAIYVDNGLIVTTDGQSYVHRDPVNAFCSVSEPSDCAITCWADWHTNLPDHMSVLHDAGPPAWIQVVHGHNVSNRVHGALVDPSSYTDALGPFAEALRRPTPAALRRDAFIWKPGRTLRDRMTQLIKHAILRMTGRSTLQRINALRQRLRLTSAARQSTQPSQARGQLEEG